MRPIAAMTLAAVLLTSTAVAQVTGDYSNAAQAVFAPASDVLNGTWARIEAPVPGTLVMQTGEGASLSGTYQGKPCHGSYFENTFSLYCENTERGAILLSGRAEQVAPQASQIARVIGQPARIRGYLTYLVIGLRPGRASENFQASRN